MSRAVRFGRMMGVFLLSLMVILAGAGGRRLSRSQLGRSPFALVWSGQDLGKDDLQKLVLTFHEYSGKSSGGQQQATSGKGRLRFLRSWSAELDQSNLYSMLP
jgi:hypothetical protein